MAPRTPSQGGLSHEPDLMTDWLTRIGLHAESFARSPETRHEILQQVLSHLDINALSSRSPASKIRAALSKRLRRPRASRPRREVLFRGVEILGDMVALSALQRQILAFAISVRTVPSLRDVIGYFSLPSKSELPRTLALILGCAEFDAAAALRRDGALLSSGLMWIDLEQEDLVGQLNVVDGLPVRLAEPIDSEESLIAKFIEPSPSPELSRLDFAHVEADVAILTKYVRAAAANAVAGVNVLFHGLPGTGKTELARVIANETGLTAYQVRFVSDTREPMSPRERLASYQLCQRLLSRGRASLVVFDEVEDVFVDDLDSLGLRLKKGSAVYGKAWMNSLLESNPVPAIWISNDISEIDRAYLRRFDFSVRFHTLPRATRVGIVKRHLANAECSESVLEELADSETLVPSQVAKAAKIITLCNGDRAAGDAVLERSIHNSRILLGQPRHARPVAHVCDLAYLNTDADPGRLVDMLKRANGSARLCFYGPPGTGKTALARLIAAEAGRRLLERKVSDLMSPWLGDTERQIADAFETASREGAILALDEAESLLLDRRDAVRSWEITQVNEMLTQLDSFSGALICSTNMLAKLDVAALRRFDVKVRFDYLTQDQSWRLFRKTVLELGADVEEKWRSELGRAGKLTPGDFVVVSRRQVLLGIPVTPASFLDALRSESALRRAEGRSIGFIAS